MLLFAARVLGALTVALSIALMSVAVYVANTQAQEFPESAAPAVGPQGDATPTEASPSLPAASAGAPAPSFWAELGEEAASPFIQEAIGVIWERAATEEGAPPDPALARPEATPEIEVRYAAPVGAPPITGGRSGRSDLSSPRVAQVPSIRPLPAGAQLSAAGLEIPTDQLLVMQRVGAMTGIPWQILAGIAKVESDFGRNMATSWAGAIGYGQFLPAMWEVFGNGGNPYDFNDVIPAMARYLLAAGAPADMPGAIYAYNHDWGYVAQVLAYAAAYTLPPSTDGRLIWPANGPISTYFSASHQGIDIDQTMRPAGTPVLASHDGIVLFAGGDPCCSYGYYVILVSPSGLSTLYAHFSTITVAVGQTVRQGQALGTVGSTGYSTGAHVHFEVIRDGVRLNPLDLLR